MDIKIQKKKRSIELPFDQPIYCNLYFKVPIRKLLQKSTKIWQDIEKIYNA